MMIVTNGRGGCNDSSDRNGVYFVVLCVTVVSFLFVCGPGLHRKLWRGFCMSRDALTKLTMSPWDHYCSCIR